MFMAMGSVSHLRAFLLPLDQYSQATPGYVRPHRPDRDSPSVGIASMNTPEGWLWIATQMWSTTSEVILEDWLSLVMMSIGSQVYKAVSSSLLNRRIWPPSSLWLLSVGTMPAEHGRSNRSSDYRNPTRLVYGRWVGIFQLCESQPLPLLHELCPAINIHHWSCGAPGFILSLTEQTRCCFTTACRLDTNAVVMFAPAVQALYKWAAIAANVIPLEENKAPCRLSQWLVPCFNIWWKRATRLHPQ